jgi:class 3 adenylate cyclase
MKREISKEIELVFLIADLSGYTALTEAHGNISAAKAVTRYVEMVREVLRPGARLVERVGDEVLIVSSDAISLIMTAISLREAIDREPLFPTVHAGIHAGSVLEREGHYYGRALNLASRVAAHARGNQILCTENIVNMASKEEDVTYLALGPTYFKNIPAPIKIFEVVAKHDDIEKKLLDPVCRMQVDPDSAPAHLPFGGRTYYFCSFDCAKAFVNNPEPYVGS